MKIAMIGLGKMGMAIKTIAIQRGHQIVSIDPENPLADFNEISTECLNNIDVGIDFTTPKAAVPNLKKFLEFNTNLVIGTTGWYDQIDAMKMLTNDNAKTGIIYASNFSVGVNVFFKIIEAAAKIIDKFPEFDVSGLDIHHNQKIDSPSGTAITTANILLDNIRRKKVAVYEKLDRKPEESEIHFASLRSGSVPGSHKIFFDSPAETVTVEVHARNREGYALGAVIAAEWICGKTGFYNFEQLIDSILSEATT